MKTPPKRRVFPLVLLMLFGVLGAAPLAAHPHVWVVAKAEVKITDGFLEKLTVEWVFDELFTNLLMMDNDANGDGKLSPAESANVKKTYFDNLAGYGYFAHLSLGKSSLPLKTISDFAAQINAEGKAVYRFTVPLGQRLDKLTPLHIEFYDATNYTDIVFDKAAPVRLQVSGDGAASYLIVPDKANAYWGGLVIPTDVVVSWKPSR